MDYTQFSWAFMGFHGFSWVLLGFTGFYGSTAALRYVSFSAPGSGVAKRLSSGSNGFHRVASAGCRVLLPVFSSFLGLNAVVPRFT